MVTHVAWTKSSALLQQTLLTTSDILQASAPIHVATSPHVRWVIHSGAYMHKALARAILPPPFLSGRSSINQDIVHKFPIVHYELLPNPQNPICLFQRLHSFTLGNLFIGLLTPQILDLQAALFRNGDFRVPSHTCLWWRESHSVQCGLLPSQRTQNCSSKVCRLTLIG